MPTPPPYRIPMSDPRGPAATGAPVGEGRARRSPLRQILDENPESRPRLGKAIAALLGTALFTLAVLGGLLIWHIKRRGRLIRERLSPPRIVEPLESPDREVARPS
jgi:hypothetical protein